MIAPQDLTMDLFYFRHLLKHTVRDNSDPEELTRLTNQIDKVRGKKKGPRLAMSLNTCYQSHHQKIKLLH